MPEPKQNQGAQEPGSFGSPFAIATTLTWRPRPPVGVRATREQQARGWRAQTELLCPRHTGSLRSGEGSGASQKSSCCCLAVVNWTPAPWAGGEGTSTSWAVRMPRPSTRLSANEGSVRPTGLPKKPPESEWVGLCLPTPPVTLPTRRLPLPQVTLMEGRSSSRSPCLRAKELVIFIEFRMCLAPCGDFKYIYHVPFTKCMRWLRDSG